ncbi:MAG: COX15/CtaA family protein [bacterium]|nr:COX15/CtaA family protein [bacterium]
MTTYNAGMSVPDWPGTYGENLFLFPMSQWLSGPWDLFIEHGHRLFASGVGLLTIAFVAVVFWKDRRGWIKIAAIVALVLVIAQGVLGGLRVLMDARLLAMIHGCVGPIFFAYTVSLAVMTSKSWHRPETGRSIIGGAIPKLAVLTTGIAYLQLVLGAQLRHPQLNADPSAMRVVAIFHVINAFILAGHILTLFVLIAWRHFGNAGLTWPSGWLLGLIVLQLALGLGAWVVNYAWPYFGEATNLLPHYVVTANSSLQAVVVTAHVAVGSLILAIGVQLAVRSARIFQAGQLHDAIAKGAPA